MTEGLAADLADVLARPLGRGVRVERLERMTAGASRVTWSFDAVTDDGECHGLVLRADSPGSLDPDALPREAALMTSAAARSVPSPRVWVAGTGPGLLEAGFVVMDRVEGETLPPRILRDDAYADVRPRLATECGRILADIHRIPAEAVPGLPDTDQLDKWRQVLADTSRPQPVLELAARWLDENRPPSSRRTVVHGDFRHGNLVIGTEGVRAVLDWELAHVGDPVEDLGWVCVKAWRFGAPLPVGGFGTVEDLVTGYEAAGGAEVDRQALHWWQIFGTFRWGVICLHQAQRHLSGATRSVELAAIGRRVCEPEWDLLQMLP
jgi:aminoglycoside phosphotransferase (APT) family kinase protein